MPLVREEGGRALTRELAGQLSSQLFYLTSDGMCPCLLRLRPVREKVAMHGGRIMKYAVIQMPRF